MALVVILISRLIGVEGTGRYFLLFSIASFGSIVMSLGLGASQTRLATFLTPGTLEWAQEFRTLLNGLLLKNLILIILTLVIVFPVCEMTECLSAAGSSSVVALVVWISGWAVTVVVAGGLRVHRCQVQASLMENVFPIAIFSISIFCIWVSETPGSLALITWVFAGSWVAAAIGASILLTRRNQHMGSHKPFRNLHTDEYSDSLGTFESERKHLWLLTVWTRLINTADIWLVTFVAGVESAAYYGLVIRLVAPLVLVKGAQNYVIGPLLIQSIVEKAVDKSEQIIKPYVWLSSVINLAYAGLILVAANYLFQTMLGVSPPEAPLVIAAAIVGRVVAVATGPAGEILRMCGQQKQLLLTSILVWSIFAIIVLGPFNIRDVLSFTLLFSLALIIENVYQCILSRKTSGVRSWVRI